MRFVGLTFLVVAMLPPQGSTRLPWILPGDFHDRLRMSDLVVSGIISGTAQTGVRTVDGAEAMAHVAALQKAIRQRPENAYGSSCVCALVDRLAGQIRREGADGR